ncbi:MAG: hypothetical protein JWM74_3851, partial [Myxococcaceae bacterium]|nr:hypothetical protein [Myxococcaceae bacterium]
DATDSQLRSMTEKSIKGTTANRAHVDDLMKKRDDIEQLLRKVQDESADGWDQFKIQVDMAVEDLKKDVSMPAQPKTAPKTNAMPNKKPDGMNTTPGANPGINPAPTTPTPTPARPTSPPSTQP